MLVIFVSFMNMILFANESGYCPVMGMAELRTLCESFVFSCRLVSETWSYIRVVVGRVIRSSAEGTRYYHEANNALIFR